MSSVIAAEHAIRNDFASVSEQLSQTERSLRNVLDNDRDKIQAGRSETAWTRTIKFYPGENEDVESRELDSFIVDASADENSISILGVNGQIDIQIYEIEFSDERLMEIVYYCLKQLRESNKNVGSLNDIFDKASIPIIRGGSGSESVNIISEVRRRFNQRNDIDYSEISPSIVSINRMINLKRAEIDAEVFNAYGFRKTDAKTILDSIISFSKQEQRVLNAI